MKSTDKCQLLIAKPEKSSHERDWRKPSSKGITSWIIPWSLNQKLNHPLSLFLFFFIKKQKKKKKSVGSISVILAVQLILVVINSVNQKHYVFMMTVYRHVNIRLLKTRLVSTLYSALYAHVSATVPLPSACLKL